MQSVAGTVVELKPVEIESLEAAFRKGFEDFQFYADIAIPEVMLFKFPPYYIAIWKMLLAARTAEDRAKIIRFALGLPRGFVKTTFIKVLICWLICYDMTEFVLNVCADEPLAYNVLADIDNILSSPNIEKIYGKWAVNKAIDNKEMKTGRYRGRNLILVAVGINSNIRGINIGHRRPDIIFFDDAQSSDNAKSDIESEKLIERFVGTFLKLVNPHHAMVIYVGNMYIGNCLLAQLRDNEGWISLITGCILESGQSLWEELHKVKDLYEEYKHDAALGLGHVWFAEKQNDPVSHRTSLLPSGQLPETAFKLEDVDKAEGGFVIIDPAGMKDVSDDNVIGVSLIFNDKPLLVEGTGGILNPEEVVNQAITYCLKYNIGVVGVEAAGYQGTLNFWASKVCKEKGLDHIQWIEMSPAHTAKQLRIIAWIKEILDSSCGVSGEVRLKVLWQALTYKMNKKKNKDDWLDMGAYTIEMKNTPEYWDLAKTVIIKGSGGIQEAKVVGNNVCF
jgi:hypothetical protein